MKVKATMLLLAALVFSAVPVYCEPLDINTADAEALAQVIIGVGDRKALEIVQYRIEHGPFASVDELTKIKGIGMKTIDRNRDSLIAVIPQR